MSRTYTHPMPATWWVRRRGYVLYFIREFSAVPIALWLIWFLVEVSRLNGAYRPHLSGAFIAFSAVCFVFAVWHTVTFLSFSGLVMRIPFGERLVPSRLISGVFFGVFFAVSAVIVGLLMWGGR